MSRSLIYTQKLRRDSIFVKIIAQYRVRLHSMFTESSAKCYDGVSGAVRRSFSFFARFGCQYKQKPRVQLFDRTFLRVLARFKKGNPEKWDKIAQIRFFVPLQPGQKQNEAGSKAALTRQSPSEGARRGTKFLKQDFLSHFFQKPAFEMSERQEKPKSRSALVFHGIRKKTKNPVWQRILFIFPDLLPHFWDSSPISKTK